MKDKIDYFRMWYEDKQGMIRTLYRNMNDDLQAGYNPNEKSITEQQQYINEYKEKFKADIELLKTKVKDTAAINRWCKLDMLKNGVIELD